MTPAMDGAAGYAVGKGHAEFQQKKDIAMLDKVNKGELDMPKS